MGASLWNVCTGVGTGGHRGQGPPIIFRQGVGPPLLLIALAKALICKRWRNPNTVASRIEIVGILSDEIGKQSSTKKIH